MTDPNSTTPGPRPDLSMLPGAPGSPERRQAAVNEIAALKANPDAMHRLFTKGSIGHDELSNWWTQLHEQAAPDPYPGLDRRAQGLDWSPDNPDGMVPPVE
jgi:hypothetical protein